MGFNLDKLTQQSTHCSQEAKLEKLSQNEAVGFLSSQEMWDHPEELFHPSFLLPSGKRRWQFKMTMFNRKYILKGSIFHCHVSLPECNRFNSRRVLVNLEVYRRSSSSTAKAPLYIPAVGHMQFGNEKHMIPTIVRRQIVDWTSIHKKMQNLKS